MNMSTDLSIGVKRPNDFAKTFVDEIVYWSGAEEGLNLECLNNVLDDETLFETK